MSVLVGIDPHATRAAAVGLSLNGGIKFVVENMKLRTGEDVREWHADAREFVRLVSEKARLESCDVIAVAIEDVFSGPNPRVVSNHAKAIGGLTQAVTRTLPHALVEIIPSRAARKMVGVRGAGKAPVREWATARFPELADASEDVIDAAMLATALLSQVEVVTDLETVVPLVVTAEEGGAA